MSGDTTIEVREQDAIFPMEVDGDDFVRKEEPFRDELEGSSDEDRGLFLPTSSSAFRTNRASSFRSLFQKNYIFVGMIMVLSLFFGVSFWGESRTPVLRFHLEDSSLSAHSHYSGAASNQTFKIMQITDIHLGEAENTDWGPRQDEKTFRLLDKIFEYEPDCDLIVLGGDQLTANNCLGNCTKYYGILGRHLSRYGIPWATIMGNHDDMDFEVEDGSGATLPHSYTRRELLRVDQSFPLSLSQSSTKDLTGVTNYVLDVLDSTSGNPALQIFFLDSGGGSLREAINDDQVKWFREKASLGETSIPAVAFQHIPTWQHEYTDGVCQGYRGEGVTELEYDAGIVDAMIESGRFHFLAVGHNHGNDYCCPYRNNENQNRIVNDLYFCFGRHSGYGGYGRWDRGVRLYELLLTPGDEDQSNVDNEDSQKANRLQWRTWVRLESGDKIDLLDYDHSINKSKDDNV